MAGAGNPDIRPPIPELETLSFPLSPSPLSGAADEFFRWWPLTDSDCSLPTDSLWASFVVTTHTLGSIQGPHKPSSTGPSPTHPKLRGDCDCHPNQSKCPPKVNDIFIDRSLARIITQCMMCSSEYVARNVGGYIRNSCDFRTHEPFGDPSYLSRKSAHFSYSLSCCLRSSIS